MEKYGPVGIWVLYATNLAAAVWAIRTAILGRALWEPNVEAFPRAPVRIAGIGAIILLAVIFARSRKQPDIDYWITPALLIYIPLLVMFVTDVVLRSALVVKCQNANPIIRGFWVTPRARAILQGAASAYKNGDIGRNDKPPASAATLYCSFPVPRDKTRVWSPASISTATGVIVLVYCLWNVLAVTGVVLAVNLIILSIPE